MRLIEPATMTTPNRYDRPACPSTAAPDPGIAQGGVRHLVGHADGERDVGEVAVAGTLRPVPVAELDAPSCRSEVLVRVAQGVDRVDHRPGQDDGQHGHADQRHALQAGLVPGQVKCVTHAQEAGDAGPDEQRPRGPPGLIFAARQLRRACAVRPDDDRPGDHAGTRRRRHPSPRPRPGPRSRTTPRISPTISPVTTTVAARRISVACQPSQRWYRVGGRPSSSECSRSMRLPPARGSRPGCGRGRPGTGR